MFQEAASANATSAGSSGRQRRRASVRAVTGIATIAEAHDVGADVGGDEVADETGCRVDGKEREEQPGPLDAPGEGETGETEHERGARTR